MRRLAPLLCAALCAAPAWSYLVSGPVYDHRTFVEMQQQFESVRDEFGELQELRREAIELREAGHGAMRSSRHDGTLADAALRRQERVEVHNANVAARGEPPTADYTCSRLATSVVAETTSSPGRRDAGARAHQALRDGLALGDRDCAAEVSRIPPIARRATELDSDASALFARYGYDEARATSIVGLITPLHPLSADACRQRDAAQQVANARRVLGTGVVREALAVVAQGHMRMSLNPQQPGVPRALNAAATQHVAWRVLLMEQAQRASTAVARYRAALTFEALLATRLLQRVDERRSAP